MRKPRKPLDHPPPRRRRKPKREGAPRVEGLGPAVVFVYGAPESGVSTVAAAAAAGAPGKLLVLDGKDPDFVSKLETTMGLLGVETVIVDGRPLDGEDLQKLVDSGLVDGSRAALCRVHRAGKKLDTAASIERMANTHSIRQTAVQNEDAFDAACQLYIFASP